MGSQNQRNCWIIAEKSQTVTWTPGSLLWGECLRSYATVRIQNSPAFNLYLRSGDLNHWQLSVKWVPKKLCNCEDPEFSCFQSILKQWWLLMQGYLLLHYPTRLGLKIIETETVKSVQKGSRTVTWTQACALQLKSVLKTQIMFSNHKSVLKTRISFQITKSVLKTQISSQICQIRFFNHKAAYKSLNTQNINQ